MVFLVITLKDCTAALSDEERRLAIEKNYPMFSCPLQHEAFLQGIEEQTITQGQASGRLPLDSLEHSPDEFVRRNETFSMGSPG